MAPYGGPPLVEVVQLLAKGELPHALGFGLPRAQFQRGADGVLELRGLAGGEGFGVQADLVRPFVDAGPLVRGTWQAIVVWLCEHWDFGEPWGNRRERVRIRFAGDRRALTAALHRELGVGIADAQKLADDGVVAHTIEEAAGACRAGRLAGANVDFDVVKVGKDGRR